MLERMPSTQNPTPPDHDGHRYATVSAHNTSQGRLAYQRCNCGVWRVQRYPANAAPVTEAVLDGFPVATTSRLRQLVRVA